MVISQEASQSPRQSRGNRGAIAGGKVGGSQPALLILHHPLTIPPAGVSHLAGRVHFPRLDFLFAFQRGRLRQMGKGIACCQLARRGEVSRSASLPAANCAKLRWPRTRRGMNGREIESFPAAAEADSAHSTRIQL